MLIRCFAVIIAAIVGAFAWSAAAQQTGAALLAQAVSATQSASAPYAFDYELDTRDLRWRGRFDPGATPRLRLTEPRIDELNADQRRTFDRVSEQMEGVSWCASENMGNVRDVRFVREDETTATYAFQPTTETFRGGQARRFADRLRGEMTMLKASPDISRIRFYVPARFSPMPLVRVDHVNIVINCAAAPNGRRFASETVTEMRGSAFGQDFDERNVQRMRNLSPP